MIFLGLLFLVFIDTIIPCIHKRTFSTRPACLCSVNWIEHWKRPIIKYLCHRYEGKEIIQHENASNVSTAHFIKVYFENIMPKQKSWLKSEHKLFIPSPSDCVSLNVFLCTLFYIVAWRTNRIFLGTPFVCNLDHFWIHGWINKTISAYQYNSMNGMAVVATSIVVVVTIVIAIIVIAIATDLLQINNWKLFTLLWLAFRSYFVHAILHYWRRSR